MTTQQISITPTTEQDRAVATITAAFSTDPVVRWLYPEARDFLAYFPRIIPPFAGAAFSSQSADVAGTFAGVALWLPPGTASDDEAMGALLEESIPDERKDEAYGFLGQQAAIHPHEPHWYLPLIGVDPSQQGGGLGSALLDYALARSDADRLPAYLEATSPRNKALYERHGFEEIGVIQFGGSPPMWPMLRRPR